MKKVICFVFFSLVFGLITSPSGNAVFGLSKCEKIKKDVLSKENQLSNEISFFSANKSKDAAFSLKDKLTDFDSKNLVGQIWKLAYNNPKCFTRTQNLEIEKRKGWNTSTFVYWQVNTTNKKTSKCQDLWELLSPSDSCILKKSLEIRETYKYLSIYSF